MSQHPEMDSDSGSGHADDRPVARAPLRVNVLVGGQWCDATAHGQRIGPHGRQVLVLYGGRFVWVHKDRVRADPE